MNGVPRKRRAVTVTLLVFATAALLMWYTKFAGHHLALRTDRVPENFWGVTFSKKFSEELGIPWRETYHAILDDLQVRNIRIPVYWDDVEHEPGAYDYNDYDWMLAEAEVRGVSVILNLGRRLPRWPECHQPEWTAKLPSEEVDRAHVAVVQDAIMHFRDSSAIEWWQLENEYFFPWFGECPKANPELLAEEIAFLKSQDSRPLVLTDSGELHNWDKAARHSDILGTTMYRVVWNNYYGYFRAPWPAWFYRIKARLAGETAETMIVAELQAEPWAPDFRPITDLSEQEWSKSFNLQQFETNSELARRTDFQRAYFWGAEWWYWLKEQGDDRMWEKAREIIQGVE